MAVIPVITTKGGSGKSSLTLAIVTTLAAKGATVNIIDADPQGTISKWSEGDSRFRGIVKVPTPGEDLTDLIDRLRTEVQFVLIDVQGTANQEMASAISRANFVLIPMRAKTADAREVPKAINLLRSQEKLFQRSIPYGIVFIATSPLITSREEKEIRKDLMERNIPLLENELNERAAFSHMFAQNLSLVELSSSDTNGLDGARENADNLAAEVFELLRNTKERSAA